MRRSGRRLPVLTSLFPHSAFHSGSRSAGNFPSPPAPSKGGDDAAQLTEAAPGHSHAPTERLAAADTAAALPSAAYDSSARPVQMAKTPIPAVRLAPAAAALLEERSRASVLQQEVCATDVLYFMTAEAYLLQQQRQQRRQRHGPDASDEARPPSPPAPEEVTEGASCAQEGPLASSASSPFLTAESRERQLADLMVGRLPSERDETGTGQRSDAVTEPFDCVDHNTTSSRFQQQQQLFALRRRLAYLLAADDNEAGGARKARHGERGGVRRTDALSALGRRAALALSLAQDILDVSGDDRGDAWDAAGEEREGRGEDGEVCRVPATKREPSADRTGRVSVHRKDAVTSAKSLSAAIAFDHHPGRCTFVYRSLAQPVELTKNERQALLEWCAERVCAYAYAVAAAIDESGAGARQDKGDSKDHAEGVASQCSDAAVKNGSAKVCGDTLEDSMSSCRRTGGSTEAAPSVQSCAGDTAGAQAESTVPQRVTCTSALHAPPTLRLAAPTLAPQHWCVDAAAGDGDGANPVALDTQWRKGRTTRISPEVCESVLSAAAALLELAAALAHLSATQVTMDSTDAAERRSNSLVSYYGGSMKETREQDGACDHETLRCGQVVCHVVDAVCETLYRVQRSALIDDYVHRHTNRTLTTGGLTPTEPNVEAFSALCGSSPLMPLQEQLCAVFRQLSFSESLMQDVQCCVRESWSQALRLTRRMHGWNTQLQEALHLSLSSLRATHTSSETDRDSAHATETATQAVEQAEEEGVEEEPLRTLSHSTLTVLLYILAQHGRLAEVLDLYQRCLHMSPAELFTSPKGKTPRDTPGLSRGNSRTAAAPISPQLIAQLAAANADPAAAARILSGAATSLHLSATPSSAKDPAAGCTQADCVEGVVRAGAMPQRVLSVTEYAVLLRRMIGERVSQQRHNSSSGDSGGGGHVGWWLSPSQVWRFSVGYPRNVRTTLCLMGFQVIARGGGVAAALSVEDLYVVLSISRQRVTQDRREVHKLLAALEIRAEEEDERRESDAARGGEAGMTDGGGQEVSRSAVSPRRRRREQRWARWGVVERVPSPQEVAPPQRWPLRPPYDSSPPPFLLTSSPYRVEKAADNDCCYSSSSSLPLLARRVGAPYNARFMECLCAAFAVAQEGMLTFFESRLRSPREPLASHAASLSSSITSRPPASVAGSAVLLSLVSREMLRLLQAVRYTRHIGSYWETALRLVAVPLQTCSATCGCDLQRGASATNMGSRCGSGGGEPRCTAVPHVHDTSLIPRHIAEQVVEEVAYALAHAAEASLAESLTRTRRLVAPLPFLAPYLSAYTVGALVQRPFRRALTWEECLALLPYTPLGSRSQLWLLRRVAQDGEGRRRRAFTEPMTSAPTPSPRSTTTATAVTQRDEKDVPLFLALTLPTLNFSQTVVHAAERLIDMQQHARRAHIRLHRQENAPDDKGKSSSNSSNSNTSTESAATLFAISAAASQRISPKGDAGADSDATLLTLLLEGHWSRALRVFERASSRVQVAGAPHVVRLLISADVWRDMADTQRRPLVRLAVQSAARAGRGGASALLEEMLETSLEHGLWHTGLYFHQCVAAEQPELVRQCRRAQLYAAQLCRGLLERTSLTRTVAQLTKAARRSQWAEAAACFLRYATASHEWARSSRRTESSSSDTVAAAGKEPSATTTTAEAAAKTPDGEVKRPAAVDNATAVPPTSAEELRMLVALMNKSSSHSDVDVDPLSKTPPSSSSSSSSTPPRAFSFFAEGGRVVPAELAHVAQTVRYAMLHTPELWMHALRWLPTSALPLPYHHEVAIRALCANNPAKLRVLLPQQHAAATDETVAVPDRLATSAVTAAALSVVAAARHHCRPQHPNEMVKENQLAVANALRVLQHAGAWEDATLLYTKAVEANCMPYGATAAVLETAALGGAPWQVTLFYFFDMAQRLRPGVGATAVALQACAEGGQWELAFRVLQQSVLTQAAPVPRLVELAVSTALHCGMWARALAAAQQFRRTCDPRLAHTILLTFVRTRRWDDAVEYFYECTRRGLRPLDASLELAIIASEAASEEYRKTALMVGTIASALEDLYKLRGAVLEHILFVQRHVRGASASAAAASASTSSAAGASSPHIVAAPADDSTVSEGTGDSGSGGGGAFTSRAVRDGDDGLYRQGRHSDSLQSSPSSAAEESPSPSFSPTQRPE